MRSQLVELRPAVPRSAGRRQSVANAFVPSSGRRSIPIEGPKQADLSLPGEPSHVGGLELRTAPADHVPLAREASADRRSCAA